VLAKNVEKGTNIFPKSKSPGQDGIPPIILKHFATEIAPILQIIFSQSM